MRLGVGTSKVSQLKRKDIVHGKTSQRKNSHLIGLGTVVSSLEVESGMVYRTLYFLVPAECLSKELQLIGSAFENVMTPKLNDHFLFFITGNFSAPGMD